MPKPIPTQVVSSVGRLPLDSRQVVREFDRILADKDTKLVIAGQAKRDPSTLWKRGLKPKHRIDLFDTTFYLTDVKQIPELRFFAAYVVQNVKGKRHVYSRLFYKDLSLAWRSASHFADLDGNIWVGKGDVRVDEQDGFETIESNEATTDLPLEMQTALENLLPLAKRVTGKEEWLNLILRKAPADRVEPYDDFTRPRKLAQANPQNLINRGRSVARFRKPNDPTSLWIAKGYQPDFKEGILERGRSKSRLYGGRLQRVRIVSLNRKVQYYFIAGKKHCWLLPPQAMTSELSSFGLRTVDVHADDDLFIPGFEYHHWEETENGRQLYSQIPDGFAGESCEFDDAKADASPWLNQIPLIQQFRKQVLGQ